MRCDKKAMLLYAVTDRAWVGKLSLYEQVECALKGGATCIQLREKDLPLSEFLDEARKIGKRCKDYGVPFIVNDKAEIAVECGADGVHVGQHDKQAREVRRLIGDQKILGVSAQTVKQAVEAEKSGADYLGVGAVYPTSTKQDASDVSRETLQAICKAVSIPVVAIGGIGKQNILSLSGSGVEGVALVSAIFSADDIESECRELRLLAEKMVNA